MEVSETTERKTENKYQDEQRFLGKECTKIHLRFMLILLFKKSVFSTSRLLLLGGLCLSSE